MTQSYDHVNPNNYKWQVVGERIVCREPDTYRMLFNCPKPQTMRQALLFGFWIGWELSDANNAHHIGWLESLLDQFRPETMPMSDEEYMQLLSELDGEPLYDKGLQDILDEMDEAKRQEWEDEKARRQKEVEESWAKIEDEIETETKK